MDGDGWFDGGDWLNGGWLGWLLSNLVCLFMSWLVEQWCGFVMLCDGWYVVVMVGCWGGW